ncbi:MAG: hypothetical protein JWN04_3840 [Myxococcaceae bacterium]|nr:hypothetical protein [Myxococcaceae bacterium]
MLLAGTMRQSQARRRLHGLSLYEKGGHFAAAGVLLQRNGRNGFVVQHLFCQALELMLKGLIIVKNDKVTEKQLKGLGHDIEKLATHVRSVYGLSALSKHAAKELTDLTIDFTLHQLRYGSRADVLFGPPVDAQNRLRRLVFAIARRAERHLPSVRGSVA